MAPAAGPLGQVQRIKSHLALGFTVTVTTPDGQLPGWMADKLTPGEQASIQKEVSLDGTVSVSFSP